MTVQDYDYYYDYYYYYIGLPRQGRLVPCLHDESGPTSWLMVRSSNLLCECGQYHGTTLLLLLLLLLYFYYY